MKFQELTAKNFFRLGDVTLRLCGQGLVLILGENRDTTKASSNGAGKSALLDALCWCLWGKTIRGHAGDRVVNRAIGKDCEVSVAFEDNGNQYRVTRYRKKTGVKKPNDLILEINEEPDDGASMDATQKRITALIGMNFITFQAMMPGAGLKVAEMTDAKIKGLLESLLQMDVIAKAQDIAKNKLKQSQSNLQLLQKNLARYESTLEEFEELLSKYKSGLQTFEEDKHSRIIKIQQTVAKYLSDCERADKLLKEQPKVTQLQLTTKARKSEKELLARELSRQFKDTEAQQHSEDLKGSKEAAELGVRVRTLQTDISRLEGLTGVCGECCQAIDGAHQEKVLQERKMTLKIEASRLEQVGIANQATSDYYSELLRDLSQQLNKTSLDGGLLSSKLKEYEDQLAACASAAETKKAAKEEMSKLADEQWDLQKTTSPFEALIADTAEKAANVVSQWSKDKKEANKLEKEVEMLSFWVQGFGVKGLRSLMLRHVTPILNARATHYSQLLTDGEMSVEFSTEKTLVNGKTKEDFNIVVVQEHGDDSYTGSSSGEKSRADLVIAFALGDLAHLRAHKRMPFRFLDEPFESIDAAGHESIIKLLNDQKAQYDTVYCITHKETFQQLFPKSIKVVKENGVSTLEV